MTSAALQFSNFVADFIFIKLLKLIVTVLPHRDNPMRDSVVQWRCKVCQGTVFAVSR